MSKLALGTVQFGMNYGITSAHGRVQSIEVQDILNYAHNHGIDMLDTAHAYGDSEYTLGKAGVNGFKIVTKTRHFESVIIGEQDVKLLIDDFNKSLMLLKVENVYGLMIHNGNDLLKEKSYKLMQELNILKEQGLIQKIGVSVYNKIQLESIIERFDVDLIQVPVNIFDRRLTRNDLLKKVHNKGIEVHARSIFLQGLLLVTSKRLPYKFNRWRPIWNIWEQWLKDNNLSPLEACVQYIVSKNEVDKVIIGIESKKQLSEIIKLESKTLPEIPKELDVNDNDLLNPSNWS